MTFLPRAKLIEKLLRCSYAKRHDTGKVQRLHGQK
jgi:hypothetical protein